jgi:hypothetical protein
MPLIITKNAMLACAHETGIVLINPVKQEYVKISGAPILIKPDPAGKNILGCSNFNPPTGIKQCMKTLPVMDGLSSFIKINGEFVCLQPTTGLTDGTPPGAVPYNVKAPGQGFVKASG